MITDFIGHLHPVLLHLPIGIFSVAFIAFYFYPEKSFRLSRQLNFMLLVTGISAFISAITGWLLGHSGDYQEAAVRMHQWTAIAFTVLTGLVYYLHRSSLKKDQLHQAFQPVLISSFLLIMYTGHEGGSLTHGADFLWPKEDLGKQEVNIPVMTDTSLVSVYEGLVQPILSAKCESCHNASKQKGGLRMDKYQLLLQGGKNGKIIEPGDAASSEMITRMMLSEEDGKHMPPKGKKQLTKKETALLHWWILKGADNKQVIREVSKNDTVRQMLQIALNDAESIPKLQVVAFADSTIIDGLRAMGFKIIQLEKGNGWLDVTTINMQTLTTAMLDNLAVIAAHLHGITLADQQLSDNELKGVMGKFTQLRRLDIRNTLAGDSFLPVLTSLDNLEYLNLVGTAVTNKGLQLLASVKGLRKVYCWNTAVTKDGILLLNKKRPDIEVVMGFQ
jgi:hypothetical protein